MVPTFGAFLFALGYRKSGLGYAIVLADRALAPSTPSNTARSGGMIHPIVRQIPALYGSEPGPSARRIGAHMLWAAFAATAATSSAFVAALWCCRWCWRSAGSSPACRVCRRRCCAFTRSG